MIINDNNDDNDNEHDKHETETGENMQDTTRSGYRCYYMIYDRVE